MRGFLVGSMALIILYVAVQPGVADKAATGGGVLNSALRRALSPQVAGVPDRGHKVSAAQFAKDAVQAVAQTKVQQAGQAVGSTLNRIG